MMPRLRHLRSALLLGGALTLGGVALVPPSPGLAATSAGFRAPTTAQVLTRELRRELVDGKEVITRRSYQIHFVREGAGWRVDGTLIATEVEAPPMLSALASLEKARPDTGLFPLHLDANGMILPHGGVRPGPEMARARSLAESAIVSNGGLPVAEKDSATAMIAALGTQTRGIGLNWPADLFRPRIGTHSDVRRLALPQGGEGSIAVTVTASRDDHGLLASLAREVVTTLAGSVRKSRESWSLRPAG